MFCSSRCEVTGTNRLLTMACARLYLLPFLNSLTNTHYARDTARLVSASRCLGLLTRSQSHKQAAASSQADQNITSFTLLDAQPFTSRRPEKVNLGQNSQRCSLIRREQAPPPPLTSIPPSSLSQASLEITMQEWTVEDAVNHAAHLATRPIVESCPR